MRIKCGGCRRVFQAAQVNTLLPYCAACLADEAEEEQAPVAIEVTEGAEDEDFTGEAEAEGEGEIHKHQDAETKSKVPTETEAIETAAALGPGPEPRLEPEPEFALTTDRTTAPAPTSLPAPLAVSLPVFVPRPVFTSMLPETEAVAETESVPVTAEIETETEASTDKDIGTEMDATVATIIVDETEKIKKQGRARKNKRTEVEKLDTCCSNIGKLERQKPVSLLHVVYLILSSFHLISSSHSRLLLSPLISSNMLCYTLN
jgi:hypothetical protein